MPDQPSPRTQAWRRLGRLVGIGRATTPSASRERPLAWRVLTPVGFAAGGLLMVTSSVNAAGTDLRPGRYDDLADLARQETGRVQALQEEVVDLNETIEDLTADLDDSTLDELTGRVDALEEPAGLTALRGPGLTVELDDAPAEIRETAGDQVSQAIVHQQDIQAVVNAMWAGGAEAVTLQGQRIISTTGIKCVGNTVLLHGVTYSPPYVVTAVGDVAGMRASLDASPYISAYLQAVDRFELGWDLRTEDEVTAPAFEGSSEMRYARPAL